MTNSSRRSRTDSTANLHRILAGANIELAPPPHMRLDDEDWPFWHNLVDERARADWSAHELEMAVFLTRTMADLEREQRTLAAEGPLVDRGNGHLSHNPRATVVGRLNSQMLALRRSLGLTSRAKAGSTRDAVRLREANRRTERAADGRDDLLA